jgi:hypothetical protein
MDFEGMLLNLMVGSDERATHEVGDNRDNQHFDGDEEGFFHGLSIRISEESVMLSPEGTIVISQGCKPLEKDNH